MTKVTRTPLTLPRHGRALSCGGLALLLGIVGCNDDDERNEARLLLHRIEAVRDPELGAWRRNVDALGTMPLSAEGNLAVRDRCYAMHDALVRAEEATEEARQGLDALAAGTDEGPAKIAAALARSEAAIAETRRLREACETAQAELRARFAPRRESPR